MTDKLREVKRLASAATRAAERADVARQARDDAIVTAVQAGHATRAVGEASSLSGEAVSKIARTRLGSRGSFGRHRHHAREARLVDAGATVEMVSLGQATIAPGGDYPPGGYTCIVTAPDGKRWTGTDDDSDVARDRAFRPAEKHLGLAG